MLQGQDDGEGDGAGPSHTGDDQPHLFEDAEAARVAGTQNEKHHAGP
jgi:hypothetical protein